MSEELTKKVESILFSVGKKILIEEIARLCKEKDLEKIKQALEDLKEKYGTKDSSLIIIQEGNEWKLTVKEAFIPYIKNLVTETDLTKTVMETLAIIAYKAPVLQSDVIKIRTNKAYDHIAELENAGYITRTKHGRTKLIKLSQKFFDYFDIIPDQLKRKFQNVEELEKSVEGKEKEAHEMITAFEAKKIQAKQLEEKFKKEQEEKMAQLDKSIAEVPEIDLVDEKGHKVKLDVYKTLERVEEPLPEEPKEKFGELEVVEEKPLPEKKPIPEPAEKPAAHAPPAKTSAEKKSEVPDEKAPASEPIREVEAVEEHGYDITKELPKEIKGEGLFKGGVPPEVQKEIEKRVKEITTGKSVEEKKEEEIKEIPPQEKQSVPEEAGEEEVEFKEEKRQEETSTDQPAQEQKKKEEEQEQKEEQK